MKVTTITVKEKQLVKEPNLKDYEKGYASFRWEEVEAELEYFQGRKFNAAHNAVSRHARGGLKNKVALYWIGDDWQERKFTFAEIDRLSGQFASYLKDLGVDRGDRVFFFLPRIPEMYYGFLGALKRGAVAGTLFSAFQEQALVDRLGSSGAKVLITTGELFPRVRKVRKHLPELKTVVLAEELADVLAKYEDEGDVRAMSLNDPAFMLYTSGSTGKPKGVVHRHGSLIQEHMTSKYVLDLQADDVYWCTADPGWVTGVAYGILGSWSLGASAVVYNGRFEASSWYRILQDWRVSVWYTAPTAVRLLQAAGDQLPKEYDFSSVRHACSVGEPLNPGPIKWGQKVLGILFHDTWFQTETGAISIANFPALDLRVGSMGKPVPGNVAAIVDENGREVGPMVEGSLVLKKGWPSMMKTIWRRPKKFKSYFSGKWFISGDRAYRDKDGYFWFVGREDDVIKTSGERVGPYEVESALIEHPAVIEAGVIGKPDEVRGQIIKAFVVLKAGVSGDEKLREELAAYVKGHLAGHAYPREIEFVTKLPKTKSGKIVRRMLRAKELGLELGDTSTLEDE